MATMTTRTAPARPASIPTRGARPPRADTRYRAPDDLAAFTTLGDVGGEMSALALYLDEVRRFPLLSVDEEHALGIALRGDDANAARDARERLCLHNLRLVYSVAKRYEHVAGIDVLDLVQEGTLGLLRAIDKYDVTRGWRFTTHATWWVWQAVQRATNEQTRVVRLPVWLLTEHNRMRQARHALWDALRREPTTAEVAAEITRAGRPTTAEQVAEVEATLRHTVSLDVALVDDGTDTFADVLADDGEGVGSGGLGIDPAERPELSAHANRQTVAWLLDRDVDEVWAGGRVRMADGTTSVHVPLTDQQRHVLRVRFGLDTGQPLTLDEAGRVLGVTRERVRQVQAIALAKLRVLAALLGLDAREVL